MLPAVRDDELTELFAWVDTIPLSKPKKHFARDFADGVCVAEIVHYYLPRLVELHNYAATCNTAQKAYNWSTLNQRVFRKLGFSLPKDDLEAASRAEPGMAERVLKLLRAKLAAYQAQHGTARLAALDRATGGAGALSADCILPHSPVASDRRSPSLGHLCSSQQREGAGAGGDAPYVPSLEGSADAEEEVAELRTLNAILEVKIAKLEQLMRLKDAKVTALQARLETAGMLHG